jgi:hypothetical protein
MKSYLFFNKKNKKYYLPDFSYKIRFYNLFLLPVYISYKGDRKNNRPGLLIYKSLYSQILL